MLRGGVVFGDELGDPDGVGVAGREVGVGVGLFFFFGVGVGVGP